MLELSKEKRDLYKRLQEAPINSPKYKKILRKIAQITFREKTMNNKGIIQ